MTTRTPKRTLLSAASAVTLMAAVGCGATLFVEHRISDAAAAAGIGIGRVDANLVTGRIAIADVEIPLGTVRARIGEVTLHGGPAFIAPALAAENVTLENVSVDAGYATWRIPRLEVTTSSLSQGQLLGLFDRNATEPLARRLARFTATSLTAPEMIIEQTIQGIKQTVTYREITARDITSGKIRTLTSAGATMTGSGGPGPVSGTFGPMTVSDLDLVLAMRLYTDRAGPDDRTPRLIYSGFSADKMNFTDDKGVRFGIDRMAGSGFKARPGETPWLEALTSLAQTKDFESMSPAERSRFGTVMMDIFDSFEFGTLEVLGTTFEEDKPDKPTKGRIDRIAVTGGERAEARVEGIEVQAPDGQVRFGLISFSGYSFKPTLEGLREMLAKPDMKADDMDPRKFMPVLGTMRFADIAADVPNEKVPNERIKMSIKGAEFTADKPFNGIPTNLRWELNNLALTIPPDTQENGLKDLVEMGYRTIDISTLIDTTWSEPVSELAVKEISFRGADMGSVVIRGVLGNITKDVFSSDNAAAQVALVGATAKMLSVSVENKGAVERGLALAAKKQGKSTDALRAELGSAATLMIPAMLGDAPAAKTIAAAVAKFVTRPTTLVINATTKDKGGLGLADFMATGGDPGALLGKLDVTAVAQ